MEVVFNLRDVTIRNYLIRGARLNWCDYTTCKWKKINIIKDEKIIYTIDQTLSSFEKISKDIFGTKLRADDISEACRGIKSQYKGFTFKYVEDDERQSV